MKPDPISIETARWPEDLPDLRAVRTRVFIHEQNVPEELEWDEWDASSFHVLARTPSGEAVGTGRLTPEGRIGRMAVLENWRGHGIGARLLQALLDLARQQRMESVQLHAQMHALEFYARAGFQAFGPEYDEAGIPHRSMRLELLSAQPGRVQETETRIDLRNHALEVIHAARCQLDLYTRELDPGLLDQQALLDALRQLAIRSQRSRIRVLVQDLRRAVQDDHGLIALLQRLPSRIEIRVVEVEPDTQYASAFMLNDASGYLFRPIASRFEATLNLHNPGRHRQLLRYFDEVWERARPASELRRL